MRLLIGWILRSLFADALAALVVSGCIAGLNDIPWPPTFLWTFGALAALSTLYWIADYLIDHEDWQREAKR